MYSHTFCTAMGNYALPNELDDNVIKHLDGHSQALVSLGRTYREFRKLTTGLLHHKIAVGKIPKSNDTMYLPMLQNIIFQLDWSEMKPYASRRIVAAFFGSIMVPRLASVTAVLERSPRQGSNRHARCASKFDVLIKQINTKCVFNNSPPILQQIQELHILVNDDTAIFKKDFLHRLKPITNLLQAACLHKLTLLWQALATVGYKMGAQFFQQFELRARLPSSLEALHTTYPQYPTVRWLQDLFGNVPKHKGKLQLFELRCSDTWAMPESVFRAKQQTMLTALPIQVSVGAVE